MYGFWHRACVRFVPQRGAQRIWTFCLLGYLSTSNHPANWKIYCQCVYILYVCDNLVKNA